MHFFFRRYSYVLLTIVPMVCSGCGTNDEVKRFSVSGHVTFQGSPVEEGQVSFVDPQTGQGGVGKLASEGEFNVRLAKGTYQVTVTPPLIEVAASETTPGGEEFKQVANIPEKYHVIETSGLTQLVENSIEGVNFELK